MRKVVIGAILALAFSSFGFASGPAVAACSATGLPSLTANQPKTDSISSGTKSYKAVVGSGQTGDVAVWGAGDVDLSICKVGSAFTCKSDLIAGSPDACNIGGWDLDGKTLEPGTYRVTITHCFGGTGGCDYEGVVPENTTVNYAITLVTA